jgi:hypothetical protein
MKKQSLLSQLVEAVLESQNDIIKGDDIYTGAPGSQ